MFLEMWNYINHSSEDYKQFMPQVYQKEPFEGDGFVQPYGDTPLDHETVGENIYLNIINHAERYVYIFTPYLIIDNEMLVSLCNAAKRGVDVRIVTPGIPDKKMIFLLTHHALENTNEHILTSAEFQCHFLGSRKSIHTVLFQLHQGFRFIHKHTTLKMQEQTAVIQIDTSHSSNLIITEKTLGMNKTRCILINFYTTFEQSVPAF